MAIGRRRAVKSWTSNDVQFIFRVICSCLLRTCDTVRNISVLTVYHSGDIAVTCDEEKMSRNLSKVMMVNAIPKQQERPRRKSSKVFGYQTHQCKVMEGLHLPQVVLSACRLFYYGAIEN